MLGPTTNNCGAKAPIKTANVARPTPNIQVHYSQDFRGGTFYIRPKKQQNATFRRDFSLFVKFNC